MNDALKQEIIKYELVLSTLNLIRMDGDLLEEKIDEYKYKLQALNAIKQETPVYTYAMEHTWFFNCVTGSNVCKACGCVQGSMMEHESCPRTFEH
tara:strand:+ start:13973 stop:14257 length:285 start_codon:yes stop_codon:yes gene_type:complete